VVGRDSIATNRVKLGCRCGFRSIFLRRRNRARCPFDLSCRPHLHGRDFPDQGRRPAPGRGTRGSCWSPRIPARAATDISGRPITGISGLARDSMLMRRNRLGRSIGGCILNVNHELPEVIAANFPSDAQRQGIFGHSMGGHGALISALKNPASIAQFSAFARSPRPCSALGPKGLHRLSRRGSRRMARLRRQRNCSRSDRSIRRYSSTRAWTDEFLAEQLNPNLFEKAAVEGRTIRRTAPASGIQPRLLFHPILHGGPPEAARRGTGVDKQRFWGRAPPVNRLGPTIERRNEGMSRIASLASRCLDSSRAWDKWSSRRATGDPDRTLQFGTVNWELSVIADGLDRKHGFTMRQVVLADKDATSIALLSGDVDAIVTDWIWVAKQRSIGHMFTFVPFFSFGRRAYGGSQERPAPPRRSQGAQHRSGRRSH